MAKNDKDNDTGNLPENVNTDALLAGAGAESRNDDDADTETHDEGDIDSDGLVSVVVLKGHTLYHDGDKYPPTSRLRVSPEDADALKRRGVVLPYSELLEQVAGYAG